MPCSTTHSTKFVSRFSKPVRHSRPQKAAEEAKGALIATDYTSVDTNNSLAGVDLREAPYVERGERQSAASEVEAIA